MGSPMSLHQRSLVCTWISPCQNPSTPLSGWSALPQLFVSSRASHHYLPLGNSSLGFLSFSPASVTRKKRTKLNLFSFFFWTAAAQLFYMLCFSNRYNCRIIKPVSVEAGYNTCTSVMIVSRISTLSPITPFVWYLICTFLQPLYPPWWIFSCKTCCIPLVVYQCTAGSRDASKMKVKNGCPHSPTCRRSAR